MKTYLDGENAQWSSVKAYKNDTLTKLIIVNDLIYTLNSKSIIVSYAIKPATGKCKITLAKTRTFENFESFDVRKKYFKHRKSRNIQSFLTDGYSICGY